MTIKLPRKGQERIGDAGRASETRLAKDLGAMLRPASGAVEGIKGDMALPDHLIEAKSTTGRSISLQHSWLGKITKEAREQALRPAVTLSFTHENGRPVPNGHWVAVPLHDWLELLEAAKEE